MNLKASIYSFYFWYFRHFPMQTGKSFLGRCLYNILGNAVFDIDGLKFELSPVGFIDKYLLYTGEFDGEVLRQVRHSLINGGTFIDVGANFGYYTVAAASLPHAKVIAFEPSPSEAARLRRNLKLNKLHNVLVHQVALSNKSEELYLHVFSAGNTGMNTLHPSPDAIAKVPVSCERFDKLVTKDDLLSCKLIKIDVEGFESEVLLGMGNLLDNYSGQILVEMNSDTEVAQIRVNWIYQLLETKGYQSKYGMGYASHYNELFTKKAWA